jgi:hypothetical protein
MEKNQKLPVLGELEATDSRKIVKWAKRTLACGRAFPQCFVKVNLLRFCVSKEIRDMWAALTSDVEGAPADDYPEGMDLDSTEAEDLAKKREWRFEWLETVISYYGPNQRDSVYEAIRQAVEWSNDPSMETKSKVRRWALSCSTAQNLVTEEAWDEADPKALFTACARVLPEAIRTLLQRRTSPRMANTPGRRRPSSSSSARWHASRLMSSEMPSDSVQRVVVVSRPAIQTRMRSNGSSNGAGEAPRVLVSAGVGVASGATSKRLPTRRRSLMPAKANVARKASLVRLVARRAASPASSASVTGKVTQIRSLPRRRRMM